MCKKCTYMYIDIVYLHQIIAYHLDTKSSFANT